MSEDEELRKKVKPRLSLSEAVGLTQKLFQVSIDEKRSKGLESYDDANFYLVEVGATGGRSAPRKFLCKFHNGVETQNRALIDGQNALMQHLGRNGFNVNHPFPNAKGSLVSVVSLANKAVAAQTSEHAVRLLSWVEGSLLADAIISPDIMSAAGAYLAKLDKALDEFKGSQTFKRTHLWDLRSFELVGSPQFTGCLKSEPKKLKMLEKTLAQFKKRVLPMAAAGKLRSALNHSDFNDANVILRPDKKSVFGVIDFGDTIVSWRVNDPAIAMAYSMVSVVKAKPGYVAGFGSSPALDAAKSFLEGYTQAHPLTDDELSVLPVLVAGRLLTSGTMGWYSYSQNPSNEYLKFHAEPAWKAAELLLDATEEVVFQNSKEQVEARV